MLIINYKFFKKILVTLMIIFFFNFNSYSIENKIILKINNLIITSIDLAEEEKYLSILNPNLLSLDKDKLEIVAKTSLIREKIKEIEISNHKLNPIDDKYIENVIRSIYNKIGINSKKDFINYIKSKNLDYENIKNKLKIEAQWNQIIINKFLNELKIDEKKIKKEILMSKKSSEMNYFLYEILYTAENKKKSDLLGKIIAKSIVDNGFENTASIYSISESSKSGGRLGWISEKSLNKKILSIISKLKINTVSKPIIIPGGTLLLLVKKKKEIENKIDIETQISKRVNDLRNEQLNQFSNIYFLKVKKNMIIHEK